ncbi:MAG TPA: hypothetical protein VN495_03120 [Candidatus Paceibacterota bacterium]|nr:hypothetical protein [Candidatus Paceibacterota bacterium]
MHRFTSIFSTPTGFFILLLLCVYSIWWALLPFAGNTNLSNATLFWGASYQIVALSGALYGLFLSKRWGGLRSIVGRAILLFSLGLLFQVLGQSISTYYVLQGVGVPYPSIGDIGFFGSIIWYAAGAILLAKASGAHISLRSYSGRMLALLLPILLLSISAWFFLRDYVFDWSQPLVIFLDFGYPLGQAFYVSMAILAFFLSRKTLGGLMKMPMLFFIVALICQYIADFTFLYMSHAGTYVAGGIDDYLYLFSYFLMATSLVQLGVVFDHINQS